MTSPFARRIDSAEADVAAARAQVLGTLGEVRRRIDPRIIASEAATDISASVNRLLTDTTEVAKSRPWLVGVGATLLGLLIALGAKYASGPAADETDEATKQTDADES